MLCVIVKGVSGSIYTKVVPLGTVYESSGTDTTGASLNYLPEYELFSHGNDVLQTGIRRAAKRAGASAQRGALGM